MSEEICHPDGRIEHPDVRREETDVSFRPILFLLIGAAVVAVVIYVGVTLFFYGWRDHETAVKQSPFPLAAMPSTDLPAGPRLDQIDRLAGIEKLNDNERLSAKEVILNSSGPTEEKGFDHIPIERAMKMLENKLPFRDKQPADAWRADGLIDSGEPNSGREFRGRP
ncbi:MAG TPA: hypothetical protein DDY78_10105 [Planctomycetales bacterium]|nr:hypothetical protein [Planctomycetales bacterium]